MSNKPLQHVLMPYNYETDPTKRAALGVLTVSKLPSVRHREYAWELLIVEAGTARPARKWNGIMP